MTNLKRPLIIVPGAGSDPSIPEAYANVARAVDPTRPIYVMHDTNKPWDDAHTLNDFVHNFALYDAHVIGCSLGGITVVHWAKHIASQNAYPGRVVMTLDSPLVKTWQDGLFFWGWVKNFFPANHLYSGSKFMKANVSDPWPEWLTGIQWMNDYRTATGGFEGEVLPNVPTPHFEIPHGELYVVPAVWERVLSGLS